MIENYEEFTEQEIKILNQFVTNTTSSIYALINLPEVIKGALFSRYSRSTLGLRSLLLKEFILNQEETSFKDIVPSFQQNEKSASEEQVIAIQKAQEFYDRILDGYGDDSIGELGGAHLAIEHVSMLAAKAIENCRIGGSPLEKSTRYIYFDQKVQGEYLYYREPVLMTSAFRDLYLSTCNMLFDTYSKLIPSVTLMMEERFPKEESVTKGAYNASIRAKTLDCLRGLLPASTLTNMGVFGNGRFYEQLLHKLHCSPLSELQEIGKKSYEELAKVIPSFVRRSDLEHRTHVAYASYFDKLDTAIRKVTDQSCRGIEGETSFGVKMVDYDPDSIDKVTAALLFEYSHLSLDDLVSHVKTMTPERKAEILSVASDFREQRRQKSPRALEHANFTFEVVADFGAYRDMHRHRMLTQERQFLSCDLGFFIPEEIIGREEEREYRQALQKAKSAFDHIAEEFPEEAQYVVPMAYNVRFYFHINLRALQWMCELRSQAAGHPNYRFIAQEMAKQVAEKFPEFERFFKFVDYQGYGLGRLTQEQKKSKKLVPS